MTRKKFKLTKPIGTETHFTWGPVEAVHSIGPYDIVEYHPQIFKHSHGTSQHEPEITQFHPYVNGKDTSQGYTTLDKAIIGAIDYRKNGIGSPAATYACKVLDI